VEPIGGGRYVVRGVLGEGAQGTTYDAVTKDGRAVAVKRFDARGAKSWKEMELAERETRVLASLDHPLVARYVEHFEEDGALYLVMEKVEGESLEAIRAREGSLSEQEVRRFLADADRALTYLHGRSSPVVHRDLKPRNVVRHRDGAYVLVDFGAVSEQIRRREGGSTVVGTYGYMAPEQFQGRATPAGDVYAVGATALALLTGREPETLPHRGLRVDVRASLEGKNVSEPLIATLERMLEPDPDLRPTSIGAALDTLRAESIVHVAPARFVSPANEDARVRSLRNLLWALWGLGWVIVPVALAQVHAPRLIPIVMFGSLAVMLIVSWHKAAVLRAILRRVLGEAQPATVAQRVRVEDDRKVRIGSSALAPHDEIGRTEVASEEARPARRRATPD
jgi:serine/threonine protein kinase